ncbi:hypothetical protein BDZ89DRAFT_1052245 [Hymenopellis radicata]|nr:hypothetical protein BDZ89DRAFT_1052245 [Hymenopellis radicata]
MSDSTNSGNREERPGSSTPPTQIEFIRHLSDITGYIETIQHFQLGTEALHRLADRQQAPPVLMQSTRLLLELVRSPMKEDNLSSIPQLWELLDASRADVILQTHGILHAWVRTTLVQLRNPPEWLQRLQDKITAVVNNQFSSSVETISFISSEYLPSLPSKTFVYTHPIRRELPPAGKIGRHTARTIMVNILEDWLGYPSSRLAQEQGRFAELLMRTYSPDVVPSLMLLPCVWNAYVDPARHLTRYQTGRRKRHISENDWTHLEEALQQVNLDVSSEQSAPTLHQALAQITANASTFTTAANPTTAHSYTTGSSPSPDIQLTPMLEFLQHLSPLLVNPFFASDNLMQYVAGDMDSFLPFRERAPTRRHLLSNPKFTNPATATSLAALKFTSLAWFETEEDWWEYQHFEEIWAASEPLYAWITDRRRSFREVLEYIRTSKTHGTLSLPTMGDLVAMLFVEDLVYAGFLDMPTPEEFATEMSRLRLGAKDALIGMGLLHDSFTSQDIAEQFLKVHRYLDVHLSQEEKVVMHFDVFMTEHALCKIKRLRQQHSYLPSH